MTGQESASGRNLSVRLPFEYLNIVMGLAKVDDVTMGEVIRNAILAYSEQRRQDPKLREKVDETKRQLDAVLSATVGMR